MLTKGDEYPLHQTPEPMALSGGNRNFYDRYFFNGYSADGSIFFAAALGIYPQLDIMDAAFCVSIDGKQYNLRASKRMGSERLDLTVGPITVTIVEPLQQLRLTVAANDSPVTADILFSARHQPIEEPRFIRREGPRLMMDYTRMTQNGDWSGTISVDGQNIDIGHCRGTRDRSWGIRQVGASESQPPPAGAFPQFWWLWTPLNFDHHACFFHSNDDGDGMPWNRRGVVDTIARSALEFEPKAIDLSYHSGSRRIKQVQLETGTGSLSITPRTGDAARTFYMSGLGYLHPVWGHGMDHGDLEVDHDVIALDPAPAIDMTTIHIQALSDAVLTVDGSEHQGIGVVEQLFIGPHASSGLAGPMDPAA
ncbi:hypothetical protein [Sphingorhabdus sp. 109]|jgi:hypothetical protein|uniref:hypothetical protein n=1 Tax=Sphingorhabdus sp. 109 TaxID=2653173 RepID=UPI0012F156D6|nr:hypothetical protein [Sphingorhabdus sp. 109]VWX60650.1 conserved hypothetical protein [Sphingorhabdus sp. 109]